MRPLSVLLLVFFSTITFAQQLDIRVNENTGFKSDTRFLFSFTVTNVSDSTANYFWTTEKIPEDTEACAYSVTGQIADFPIGIESSPCDPAFTNTLEPSDSTSYYGLEIFIEESFTQACINYCLIDACVDESHDTIVCKEFKLNELGFTSTFNNHSQPLEITAYPNPSNNVLRLRNDELVSCVKIYAANGQRISILNHQPQVSHDISHLAKGLYFLEFHNRNGQKIDETQLLKL